MNESSQIWPNDIRVPPLPAPNFQQWQQNPPSLEDVYQTNYHCHNNLFTDGYNSEIEDQYYCCRRCSRRRRRRRCRKFDLEEQIVRVLERRNQSRKRARNCHCRELKYCQQARIGEEQQQVFRNCSHFCQGNGFNHALNLNNNSVPVNNNNNNNHSLVAPINFSSNNGNNNHSLVAPINNNGHNNHSLVAPINFSSNSNSNNKSNIAPISSSNSSNNSITPVNNNSNSNSHNSSNIAPINSSNSHNNNTAPISSSNSNNNTAPITYSNSNSHNNSNHITTNNSNNNQVYNSNNMFETNSYYSLSDSHPVHVGNYMVSPGLSSVDSGYAGSPMDAMAGLENAGSLMDAFDEADIETLLREMVGNNDNNINTDDALPDEFGTGTGSGISTGTGSADQVGRRAVVGVVEPRVVLKIPKRRVEKQNCLEEEMSITRTLPDFFKKALGSHVDSEIVEEEEKSNDVIHITACQEPSEFCEIAQNCEKSDRQRDLLVDANESNNVVDNDACSKEGNVVNNEDNSGIKVKRKEKSDVTNEPLSKRRRKGRSKHSKKKLMSNSESDSSQTLQTSSLPLITSLPKTSLKTIFVEKEKEKEWHNCTISQNCSFFTREKSRQILHSQCHVTASNLHCHICKEKQGSLRQLLRHQRISHQLHSADFECRICDKKVTDLGAHVKTKHQETKNAFKCTDCNKNFRHRHSLIRHMIKHSTRQGDNYLLRDTKNNISTNKNSTTTILSNEVSNKVSNNGGRVLIQNALCLWPPGTTLLNNNNILLTNLQNTAFLVDPFAKNSNNFGSNVMEIDDEIQFVGEVRPQQRRRSKECVQP